MNRRYRRPRRPAFTLDDLDISAGTRERLQALGIVSALQLFEVLFIPGRDLQGINLGRLRTQVERQARRLLGADVLSALGQDRASLPVLGIAGPASQSRIIRARRRRTSEDRRALAAHLRETGMDEGLPGKMLLVDWMSDVGDQGNLGSCTGWGSSATRELPRFCDLRGTRLSPLFAYMMAKELDGRPDLEGSWQHFCFEGMHRWGHVPEEVVPYTDQPDSLDPSPFFEAATPFRIDGYCDLLLEEDDLSVMPTLIKAMLAGRLIPELGPQTVSVSIAVHDGWRDPSAQNQGLIRLPLPGETIWGGHAMCVAGYLDADAPENPFDIDYFVVKNSWGTQWAADNPLGLPGYALFPAAYFTDFDLTWAVLLSFAEVSPVPARSWLNRLRVLWTYPEATPSVLAHA